MPSGLKNWGLGQKPEGESRCFETWRRLQRLEDAVLPDTNGMHVRDETCDDDQQASVKVSARVRDIITRNLATQDAGWSASAAAEPGIEQLVEDNKILQVLSAFTDSLRI